MTSKKVISLSIDVLESVGTVFVNSERWTTGHSSRDEFGGMVIVRNSEKSFSFCSIGAIMAKISELKLTEEVGKKVQRCVLEVMEKQIAPEALINWNDSTKNSQQSRIPEAYFKAAESLKQ